MRIGAATFVAVSLGSMLSLSSPSAYAADVNFLSTQLRPVEEADKFRNVVLKGAPDPVKFIPEEDGPFVTRLLAEVAAGKGSISVAGALEGGLGALSAQGALADVGGLMKRLSAGSPGQKTSARQFIFQDPAAPGSGQVRMIPWMYTSFIMVANKKALAHLPAGADINALTYKDLHAWAKKIKDTTGEAKLGFPAGPKGLMHRFFQGYLYPSYTGGLVTTFRSQEAAGMWAEFRDLWQYVNPRSTAYGFMEEPLLSGEVWIAFDHTARLLPALRSKPEDFVAFPAPAGPKGRGYLLVLAGLAIPTSAPDKAAAERLIDYLTKPETQLLTLQETGFYPVVKTEGAGAKLADGILMAQRALNAQATARGAKPGVIPASLGAKAGEFNKVFIDAFQRIVLNKEDIAATLKSQAETLSALMKEAKVPCWAPDTSIVKSKDICAVQ
jgi:multiple sugar transport system substrate-binding protein